MSEKFRIGKYWLDRVSGSPNWYACSYSTGSREVSRRSLKTSDGEEAKIKLAEIVLSEGEAKTCEPDKVALATVLQRYVTEHGDRCANVHAGRTAAVYALEFYGSATKVHEITRAKQRDFIRWLWDHNFSVGYIARLQACVSAALNRAVSESEILTSAPKTIISPSKIAEILNVADPVPDNWHPTLEQIAAFMDAAVSQNTLQAALLTLAFAGRPEAVCELTREQFDTRHNLLTFNEEGRRQTKKYRPTVPVPARLVSYLTNLTPIAELDRRAWAKTRMIAGVPAKFRPKSLRHFMATEMRKRGVPREQREEWMGHRRHATNDRYGHFAPDFLKEARDCADAVLGELELLAKLSIYRQVAGKPNLQRFDPVEQSPVVTDHSNVIQAPASGGNLRKIGERCGE